MTKFDWELFSNVGDDLSQINDEAHIRSAISRYYYAVFGSARYYLAEYMYEESFLHVSQAHSKVCTRLKSSHDDNESALGELLENLMEKRVDADYLINKDDEVLNEEYFIRELPMVQSLTREALLHLSALKNNPPRQL